MRGILVFIFTFSLFSFSRAQTTYTWIGATGASWAVSTNWSPTRTTPATTDIILFNSGTVLNVTAVPAQTIRSLTVTNNSNITLTGAAGTFTLSINGPSLSNNLQIDAGSTLQLTSAGTTLTLNFSGTASQRGQIDGTLQLNTKGLFITTTVPTTLVTVGNGGAITNNYQTGGGTPVTGSAATLQFASGSNYNHITSIQVAVPTATYDVNSTANFTAGTSNINNMTQTFGNVTVNSAGTLTLVGGSPTIAGVFTLTSGVFAVGSNSLTLNGTMAASGTGTITSSGAITIGGSGGDYGTLRFTSAPTLSSFTINRSGSGMVGLNQALTINSVGTLNLSNGVINTNGNLISVLNGTAAAVTNTGGINSYVNGALQRTFNANLSSATIIFPIGKTACQKMTFTGFSTTSSASALVVQAEAFDGNCSGTFDPSLTALNTDNYWNAKIISNAASLSTPGTISLTDVSPALSSTDVIATCTFINGSYSSIDGSQVSPVITSNLSAPLSLGYFVIGTKNTTPLCGIYSIGPTGNFATVTAAVNSLNTRTVSCNVVFELQTTYTGVGESFPITITYSGSSARTATFRPVAGAGTLTTAGDPGSGFALINFNSADYVKFDGRPGGTGTAVSWIIRNSRTASLVGPAIQFSNGATYDSLQYVRVESQNSSSTSGTIYISSYPLWTAGNNHLGIQNCDITKYTSSTVTHVNAIYAYGETAFPNSYISILNNNIHSFTPGFSFEATGVTVTGTGINTNYGDNWTIQGNSFYLDCAEQQLYRYTVINFIPGLSSTGNTISGNYIGGGAPLCAGTTWTSGVSGAGNTIQTFEGIYVRAGATNITGNTIQNISLTGTGVTSFGAIHLVDGGASSSYSVSNNTIGSSETCNSIRNAGQWKSIGIWCDNTCGNVTLSGNTIANLTATNAGNTAAFVTGIYSDCGSNTITNNTIFNLTTAIAYAGPTAQLYIAHDGSVAGIADNSIYSGTTQTISGNIIYNLKSTYTGTNNNKLYGIYTAVGNAGHTHVYNANLIFGFDTPNGSTNAKHIGIGAVGSSSASAVTCVFSNNMIHLGTRIDGTSITAAAEISGLLDNTSGYTSGANTTFMNYYNNSVYITGTGITGTTNTSAAFRRNNTNISPKNTEDIKGNIFVNTRSNSTGTKNHYSIFLDNSSTVSCNYNDGWGSGTGYLFGNSASTNYAALSNWQAGTGFDNNTVAADPLFQITTLPPDLHIQAGSPVIGTGINTSVSTDFDAENIASPFDIGADKYNAAYTSPSSSIDPCGRLVILPIELLSFTGTLKGQKAILYWSTISEIDNAYFTVERSFDAINFEPAGTVPGAGNSSAIQNYSFSDDLSAIYNSSTVFYYRLKQNDLNGNFSYSPVIGLEHTNKTNFSVQAFPNPVTDQLTVVISGADKGNCSYNLTDLYGKEILNGSISYQDGKPLTMDLRGVETGIYLLSLTITGKDTSENVIKKIVKSGR
jgi:hypothetical protein